MQRRVLLIVMLFGLSIWLNNPGEAGSQRWYSTVSFCPPLPPSSGSLVQVDSVSSLVSAVNAATPGTVILVADGIYHLDGAYLRISVPGVTLRGASGDRESVVLDGGYVTTEIVQVVASGVTIADLTLRQAYNHPIHIMPTDTSNTDNTLVYNVHIIDPGEQAIKINPVPGGYFTDNGVIACSTIELTDAGRAQIRNNCYTGGVDAHQSRGWSVLDNLIQGFWCESGLSEHAIHFWRGSRDTLVQRNQLLDNARGVGFGLATDGEGRSYPDAPCPAAGGSYVDHFGGMVRNNFVAANDGDLLASGSGFDCGICLWNACEASVLHNTIFTADASRSFSAIEWRFPNTSLKLANNLANFVFRERDGAVAVQSGNLSNADASWFVDAASGDLHLQASADQAIDTVSPLADVPTDIDGEARPIGLLADVGADEFGIQAPPMVHDLKISDAVLGAGTLSFTLQWTPPAGAVQVEIRSSTSLITPANWGSAAVLTTLPGSDYQYSSSLPYSGGMLYFALEGQDAQGSWSPVSNNAFWPNWTTFIPLVR